MKDTYEGCQVLYLETPTNPTLKVLAISRLAQAAHRVGAVVVVDNTVATPINQNPLALGADLVLHSATKFLGGYAEAPGGVVCGSKPLIDRIYHYREITGATLDPMAAYLLLRGRSFFMTLIEKSMDPRVKRTGQVLQQAFLVIDRHAGHIGLASNGINRKARETIRGHEQCTSCNENASTRLFSNRLSLTKSIWARAHTS